MARTTAGPSSVVPSPWHHSLRRSIGEHCQVDRGDTMKRSRRRRHRAYFPEDHLPWGRSPERQSPRTRPPFSPQRPSKNSFPAESPILAAMAPIAARQNRQRGSQPTNETPAGIGHRWCMCPWRHQTGRESWERHMPIRFSGVTQMGIGVQTRAPFMGLGGTPQRDLGFFRNPWRLLAPWRFPDLAL